MVSDNRSDDDRTNATPPPSLSGFRLGECVQWRAGPGGDEREWAARDAADRPVLVRERRAPPQQAARLERRLQDLRRHPHRNLLPVHAAQRTGHGVVYAVGPTPGVDLATWRNAYGALSPRQIERLVLGAGAAVAHLHAAGIPAGPIEPDRVVLDGEGQAVLDLTSPVLATGSDALDGAAARWERARACDLAAIADLAATVAIGTPGTTGTPVATGTGRAPESPGRAAYLAEVLDGELAAALDRASVSRDRGAPLVEATVLASLGSVAVARRDRQLAGASTARTELAQVADLAAEAVREHVLAAPSLAARPSRVPRTLIVLASAIGVGVAGSAGLDAVAAHSASIPAVSTTSPSPAAISTGVVPAPATRTTPLSVQAAFLARDAALTAADPASLASAVVPGSPAWRHDVALLRAQRGVRLVGLRTAVVPGDGVVRVRQLGHVRVVMGLPRWVPPQAGRCHVLGTDAGGRLDVVTSCPAT